MPELLVRDDAIYGAIDAIVGLNVDEQSPFTRQALKSFLKHLESIGATDPVGFLQSCTTREARAAAAEFFAIGETYFYRDPSAIAYLRERVVPAFLSGERGEVDRNLAIWCAGCSLGCEAYTVATVLEDARRFTGDLDYTILATDIRASAVEHGRRGRFTYHYLRQVSESMLSRYFDRDGEFYTVADSLRSRVHFELDNLIEPPPVDRSRFHVIKCTNVLMHLSQRAREIALARFRRALAPGGILMVSSAESHLARAGGFIVEDPRFPQFLDVPPVPVRAHDEDEIADSCALARQAWSELDRGAPAAAAEIAILEEALEPELAEPCLVLAHVYQLNGEPELARAALERGVRREPDNPRAHFMLGCIELSEGLMDSAVAHFRSVQEAVRKMPPNDPVDSRHDLTARDLDVLSGRLIARRGFHG